MRHLRSLAACATLALGASFVLASSAHAQAKYRTESSVIPVAADGSERDASVGAIAYTRDTQQKRPVLFAFNGGPGASSTFLHLGVLGPWRVEVPTDPAADLPEAGTLVSNNGGLLDVADLVFLDPPGTGLSSREDADPTLYSSVAGDAAAVAQAVANWLAAHDRSSAPVYILGESYGTIRAAAMLDAFAAMDAPPDVRGVVLLGQALNMIETSQRADNIVSHVVSLPTLAAIACYYGRAEAPCDPREGAIEAARFGREHYLDALYVGSRIDEATRVMIAERLQALTGIPAAFFEANDLHISKEAFRVALLRDEGRVTGRYDARYTAPLPPEAGELVGPDAFSAVSDLYSGAMPGYLRRFGVVPDPDAYKIFARFEGGWAYGGADSPFSDWPFMTSVERAAERSGCLRLFIGTGLFDLTTTVGAADYLLAKSDLAPGRVTSKTYDAGHMFYSDPASREALLRDLRDFVRGDTCR